MRRKSYTMDIIKTNIDSSNKALVYKLTRSSGKMVQDIPDGTSVPVQNFCLYNDPKESRDGTLKENTVLSFTDTAGGKFSTISATFIREFLYIADLMGDAAFTIIVVHGTTKGGKQFVSCELYCDA